MNLLSTSDQFLMQNLLILPALAGDSVEGMVQGAFLHQKLSNDFECSPWAVRHG